jgi:hypothetical protein
VAGQQAQQASECSIAYVDLNHTHCLPPFVPSRHIPLPLPSSPLLGSSQRSSTSVSVCGAVYSGTTDRATLQWFFTQWRGARSQRQPLASVSARHPRGFFVPSQHM